jgi:surface carbohydrate biosynthesis protein
MLSRRTFTLARIGKCDILKFGGLEVGPFHLLSSSYRIEVLPILSESVNIRALAASILRFRFGRWGYYRTYVEMSEASLLCAWHDSNIEAFLISRHVQIPVCLIQNGIRHNLAPPRGRGLIDSFRDILEKSPRIDKYFVLNHPSEVLLSQFISGAFEIIGSFRLNEFAVNRNPPTVRSMSSRRTICLITSLPGKSTVPGGQLTGNTAPFASIHGTPISFDEYFRAEKSVAIATLFTAKLKSLEFFVLSKRDSQTESDSDFFGDLDDLDLRRIIPHEKGRGYEVADSFDYLVAVDSTLGYEMLALGHKVAFISNRFRIAGIDSDEMTFAYPLDLGKDGPFWTSATTQEGIVNFLHQFLSLTDDDWSEIRRIYVPRLMALDPGNTKLRAYIDGVLGRSR